MRMSQYFLPTLKETPSEAQIVSHRLMLRAGLIRQTSAGIYAWLPLGLRVLRNIERMPRVESPTTPIDAVPRSGVRSTANTRSPLTFDRLSRQSSNHSS